LVGGWWGGILSREIDFPSWATFAPYALAVVNDMETIETSVGPIAVITINQALADTYTRSF